MVDVLTTDKRGSGPSALTAFIVYYDIFENASILFFFQKFGKQLRSIFHAALA